jgi:Protein of unknown function (DUF4238)
MSEAARLKNEPKRHHYLPEFFLNGFCRNGKLWLFDRPRDGFREQTPENTGVKRLYYAFEDQAGTRHSEIETFLSRVEGDAKHCVDRLRAGHVLSQEERAKFAMFLALMHTRVPEFHEFVQEVNEKTTKATMRLLARQPGRLETLVQQANEMGGDPSVTADQMREFFERDEYRVRIDRSASLRLMMELAFGLANALNAANWGIFEAADGTSFVTSDNPVFPHYPKQEGFYPTPFLSPEVAKIAPLAHDTLLVMGGTGGLQVRRAADRASVRAYNVLTAHACLDYVIGRDEALVRSIVARAKVRTRPPRERVRMG